ncbi:MAG: hypothetical protein CTR54_22975 [Rhizobium sp.]|nr:MAG: hypothetical protein CTR54_22975 [Rhizobium sp.]
MVRADHAIKPVEITMDRHVVEPGFKKQGADAGPLVMADLHHEPAIRLEPAAGLGGDDAVRGKAIRPAIEGQARVEIPDLGGEGFDHGGSDIGGIGDDEVEFFLQAPPLPWGERSTPRVG